jgi:hypothetical protein
MRVFIAISIGLLVTLTGCSNTKPEPTSQGSGQTYRELIIKDYDEMQAMMRKHLRAAHKIVAGADSNSEWEHDAKAELARAERLVLSRPDTDNMVAKLVPEIRHEIAAFGSYDDLLDIVTTESLEAFRPDMNLPVAEHTTFLFILENLMSEMKPNLQDPRQLALMERIRDAKIEVPHDVMAERKLQGMFLTDSPSDEARRIIDDEGFGKKKKH